MQKVGIGSEWRAILECELNANEELFSFENSFMFQLRCGPGWNEEAYLRLSKAMVECCKAHEGQTHVERWIAAGFDWMDSYPRQLFGDSKDDFYINAIHQFESLKWWLFQDEARMDNPPKLTTTNQLELF